MILKHLYIYEYLLLLLQTLYVQQHAVQAANKQCEAHGQGAHPLVYGRQCASNGRTLCHGGCGGAAGRAHVREVSGLKIN